MVHPFRDVRTILLVLMILVAIMVMVIDQYGTVMDSNYKEDYKIEVLE